MVASFHFGFLVLKFINLFLFFIIVYLLGGFFEAITYLATLIHGFFVFAIWLLLDLQDKLLKVV